MLKILDTNNIKQFDILTEDQIVDNFIFDNEIMYFATLDYTDPEHKLKFSKKDVINSLQYSLRDFNSLLEFSNFSFKDINEIGLLQELISIGAAIYLKSKKNSLTNLLKDKIYSKITTKYVENCKYVKSNFLELTHFSKSIESITKDLYNAKRSEK